MDDFNFYSPTYFVFGKEREKETRKYIRRFNGSKVLIHYGGGSVIKSGLLERIKKSLKAENIPYIALDGVVYLALKIKSISIHSFEQV